MEVKKTLIILGFVAVVMTYFFLISQYKQNKKLELASIIKNGINIEEYGVRGDGITDETEKMQHAIVDAARKNQVLIVPAKTYVVSPLKYREPTSSDWWCLALPKNAKIYFEPGAVIKLVDDAPDWTRIIVISEVSNVNLYGHIQVDGSADKVTSGNEHMHGIYIYDAKDIFIESAHSYNSYGDNLFIGGTEEHHSENITIEFYKGVTAGRKNLVIHYVDNLLIHKAILDNTKGGVGNNWSGENSLDLEPDDFTGNHRFYQRIDDLTTYGKGNDFTVGIDKRLAEKWVLDIGNFHVTLMEGPETGIISYAATVNINKLWVTSHPESHGSGLNLSYGANWVIDEGFFLNGWGYAISAKASGGEHPTLRLGKIYISRPHGAGVELWGAAAIIEHLEINDTGGRALNILSTTHQEVEVKNFTIKNSGESELIYVSDYGYEPHVRISDLVITDNRNKQIGSVVHLETKRSVEGFEIENITYPINLKKYSFGPTVESEIEH